MNKILIVPGGKTGDIIIKAYKDAGYKFKKPKYKKVKITSGDGILNQIYQREKVEQDGDDERRNVVR